MNTDPSENKEKNMTEPNFAAELSNNALFKRGVLIVVIVFLALIVFGFVATRSLPGEMLYGVKTNFIEMLNEQAQFSAESKARYQVERMETRLAELKALRDKNAALSSGAYDDITKTVGQHKEELQSLTQREDQTPQTRMLGIVSDFASVAAAMEQIAEREETLQELGEYLEDVRRDAVNLHQDLVNAYVERETPENIYNYIRQELDSISAALGDRSISEQTIDDAEVYISRVAPAMSDSNYPRAITAIAEAMRFIQIEQYGAVEVEDGTPNEQTSTSSATTSTTTEVEATTQETAAPQTQSSPSFSFPE